jgi:glycosyltransferase involved in cell wall biosynthesis
LTGSRRFAAPKSSAHPLQPHLLVFEPDARGHVREWIEHLVAGTARYPARPSLTVVCDDSLAEALACSHRRSGVTFIGLTEDERRACMSESLAISGFARWSCMRRYLKRTGADHGIFLGMDHLTLPLGLWLGFGGAKVSGILFRPSVHYPRADASLGERLRELRKHLLYQLTFLNGAVEKVLTLDPYFPAYAEARYLKGSKVATLLDPAFEAPIPTPEETRLAGLLPKDRKAFLLFGELTERKGVLELLEALARLPDSASGRCAVMIAGRVDPPLKGEVARLQEQVRLRRPDLWLHIEDRRLATGEIAALVARSAVVLAPYQRFVGSSGILLWAARFGRPLICQDYGLVGRLAREHRLGRTVDTGDPDVLAAAIAASVAEGDEVVAEPDRMRSFVENRTPESFAYTVLETAIRGVKHREVTQPRVPVTAVSD